MNLRRLLNTLLVPLLIPLCSASAFALDDLDELRSKVRGDDERKRQTAVKALAEVGSEAAWELVIERLADDEPEVADQAQLELARIDGEGALELLHGRAAARSKNALVRARVAESLGRADRPLEPEELARLVKDTEPEVRRIAWWSVERSMAAGRLVEEDRDGLVDTARKAAGGDRDPAVRGAALIALSELAPAVAIEEASDALRPKQPEPVRMAAMAALARAGRALPETVDAAIEAVGRAVAEDRGSSLGLRFAAADALARIRSRGAVEALVDLLEAEEHPRLESSLVARLRARTGAQFGNNPRGWRAWLEARPEDWVPLEGSGALEVDGSVARLAGLPLLSNRIAILIDMSGSMWMERDGGGTLKELVDAELRTFLEKLPPETRFNLIPYATAPDPWSKQMVDATPRNVARALEWFEKSRLRGKGSVWEAIDVALADEDVDTVILLTDGAPTGGLHWNLDLIVPLLLERNRFRHVAFDSILTDPKPFLLRKWSALATGSAGVSVEVRFGAD